MLFQSSPSSLISLRSVAIVTSWKADFRGDSVDLLYKILNSYMGKEYSQAYVRYASFVQSSGTGKSRQMDELAKRVVSIPLNLNDVRQDGKGFWFFCRPCCIKTHRLSYPLAFAYPPPDDAELQRWLKFENVYSDDELQRCLQSFIYGLMIVTHRRLIELGLEYRMVFFFV